MELEVRWLCQVSGVRMLLIAEEAEIVRIELKTLNRDAAAELLGTPESHFIAFKAIKIAPAKLTKTISAFANTSGG